MTKDEERTDPGRPDGEEHYREHVPWASSRASRAAFDELDIGDPVALALRQAHCFALAVEAGAGTLQQRRRDALERIDAVDGKSF